MKSMEMERRDGRRDGYKTVWIAPSSDLDISSSASIPTPLHPKSLGDSPLFKTSNPPSPPTAPPLPPTMAPQVWLVTGTTSGIGKAVVQELLRRGDSVIATGRNVEARLGPLLQPSSSLRLLELDITSDLPTLTAKIHHAWSLFGHIDVILHNAGVNQLMSAEEAT